MNQPQDPAKLPSTSLPPASDTVRMSDSVTEEEVDDLVREALAVSSQLQVSSDSANSLLARLADLKIIRQLAGGSQKLESIGPFEFLEEIGRGGMGAVYKARHRQLGKIQAVKVIHTDATSNSELLARFKREVRAIGSLSHPNIIAAHHADVENGSPYLVMDYVEGDSLSNIQKNLKASGKQISVGAACEVIRQASLGIQYAHEQEITHRDIKPGNMVLDRHGVVRVLDLGLAQLAGQATETEVTELTRGDQILGTPDFMSPEQLRSTRSVDSRTDIYSLGATLYVLLTGSTPYPSEPGEGFIAKANRILNDTVPDARKLRPEIPKQLAQIVSKCLQKSSDKRFQSAGELSQALEAWSNAEELDQLQPRLPGAVARKSQPPKSATLKSALPSANRRLPPRNVWMAIVGGLFLLPMLAGILIYLTIPGVGQLIIESSDPNVTVLLKRIDGRGSQTLQVEQGPNKPTNIKVGDWDIEIQGVDASKLVVTPSRVEIGRNQPTVVRIERRPVADIAEGPSSNSAAPDTPSDNIASSVPQPIAATESQNLAPAQFAMEQGWTPGDVQRIRPGLVPQPANVHALFDWQMQLIRAPTGIIDADYPYLRHLDPRGKLVAWIVAGNVIVADIETGTILQVIPNVDGTLWDSVRFSPSGEKLCLVTQNGASVEIRSRAGQLLERWKTNANFRFGIQAWLPKEQHLALANESKIAIFDLQGSTLQEFSFPESFARAPHIAVTRSRQSVLLLGSDGILQEWLPQTNAMKRILAIPNWTPNTLGGFAISGDETRIITWDTNDRTFLWDLSGMQLGSLESMLLNPCWSPDGRYLVDANRTIYDANNLKRVTALALAPDDLLQNVLFDTYWLQDDEITLLSQTTARISSAGEIRRFHPSGRPLPSPRWPQPMAPGSVTFDQMGLLTSIHAASATNASLAKWNPDGTLAKFNWCDVRPAHLNSNVLAWSSKKQQVILLDRDQTIAILDMQGKTVRKLTDAMPRSAIWNPNGDQFAVVQHAEDHGQIVVFGDQDTPIWKSPSFAALSAAPHEWSPDGSGQAWTTTAQDSTKHWLHLVKWTDPQRPILDIPLIDPGHAIAFSPDSQWLVTFCMDRKNVRTLAEVVAFHLPTAQTFRQTIQIDAFNARRIAWSDDSRTFLAGGIMHLSPDDGQSRLGTYSLLSSFDSLFHFQGDRFITCDNAPGTVRTLNGEITYPIGLPASASSGHVSRYQSNPKQGSRLAFRTNSSMSDQKPVSVGEMDVDAHAVRWAALIYDDGQALSFNSAGAVLQGPADIDRYVVYTIHYSGGKTVAVTHEELHNRLRASAGQRALLWANDVYAKIYGSIPDQELQFDVLPIEELPPQESISQIDLSGLREVSNKDLEHVSHLTGLKLLKLRGSLVNKLPNLSALTQLEAIDALESALSDVSGLRGMRGLKRLDLSQTKVLITSNSIENLVSLTSLEHLSLNGLKFEPFTVLELGKLTQLKKLSLIGVELAAADLQQLKKALPTCEIFTDEKDRERSRIAGIAH